MPNWCSNSVTLVAPNKELIDGLIASLEGSGEEKFFNYLHPRPQTEEDWYNWNCNNWGSKWDADPYTFERLDDTTIDLSFDSAWSPPTALYDYLTENGWNVTARYYEPGVGFVGEYVDGFDQTWEYDLSDEETLSDIPEDLIEWAGIRQELADWKEMNDEDDSEEA